MVIYFNFRTKVTTSRWVWSRRPSGSAPTQKPGSPGKPFLPIDREAWKPSIELTKVYLCFDKEFYLMWGPQSTIDCVLTLQPAALGSILRIPKFFSRNVAEFNQQRTVQNLNNVDRTHLELQKSSTLGWTLAAFCSGFWNSCWDINHSAPGLKNSPSLFCCSAPQLFVSIKFGPNLFQVWDCYDVQLTARRLRLRPGWLTYTSKECVVRSRLYNYPGEAKLVPTSVMSV